MDKIAHGELNSRISIKRDDEIGTALRNIQAMQAKLGFDREVQIDTERRIAAERKAEMQKLASRFRRRGRRNHRTRCPRRRPNSKHSAGTLTSHGGARPGPDSHRSPAASEEATANVQSVASATEEMTSSVNEISRQVQESSPGSPTTAVDQARKTNDRVSESVERRDPDRRRGGADQQHRRPDQSAGAERHHRGGAGRRGGPRLRGGGASEVKALAEQTAKATDEIGQQISGIQTATKESVAAIKEIGDTIGRLSEIASTIASAVEEQGAATQEIARNVQQAAQGTMEVSVPTSSTCSAAPARPDRPRRKC